MSMANKTLKNSCNTAEKICMSRLVREMEILTAMSLKLQSGIHSLDLSASTSQTRKVLQSADKLSQTLICVKIAIEYFSHGEPESKEADFHDLLNEVFLEDVRERLLYGENRKPGSDDASSGVVEMF